MFESQDRSGDVGGPVQNATDKRCVGITGVLRGRDPGVGGGGDEEGIRKDGTREKGGRSVMGNC